MDAGVDEALVPTLLELLFWTHASYADRESRIAVQKSLIAILARRPDPKILKSFILAVRQESQKPGIAISSAFVLVEWCSLLMQHLAGTSLWAEFGSQIVSADADALEKCLQPIARNSVAHSAIIVTRRGLRKLFSDDSSGEQAVRDAVQLLSAKASQPTTRHGPFLGVIAGVAARNAKARPVLESVKSQYFSFYTRELVGSRTPIPMHIASSLKDFFIDFVTLEEFEKEVIPAVEKGLLRAPEIVLCDLVDPLVRSLPVTYDLSRILHNGLLKPIVSSSKSSNAEIRGGAVTAFKSIVARCADIPLLEGVADEIAAPLKTGKLASADHRTLHAEMLAAIPLNKTVAEKISASVAVAVAKEGNEAALAAETLALAKATVHLLRDNEDAAKTVVDVYSKGLADKKAPFRRLWLLRSGDVLNSFRDINPVPGSVIKFAESLLPKLTETHNEVIANPVAASQSGLVVGSYVLCMVSSLLQQKSDSAAIKLTLKKLSLHTQCLVVDPKPSFLLNPRVYSKLTAEDDLRWLCQALFDAMGSLQQFSDTQVSIAWSEAVIYLVCSSAASTAIQKMAGDRLSRAYARNPGTVSKAIAAGVWHWLHSLESGDKESAAVTSKTGSQNLHLVLKAICLGPSDFQEFGSEPVPEQLEEQLCSLLILARPELVPRASWIGLCLRVELDPGALARKYEKKLIEEIISKTSMDQEVRLASAFSVDSANMTAPTVHLDQDCIVQRSC
jgi:hypothetical protein